MSNYWNMREAKVNIAHALMDLGWKVYGYKKDESDSMTDYFSPAAWDGIAIKNGFILVVDNDYPSEGRDITKYNPKGNLSYEDQEKIKKLEQMTQSRGATPGEEENAKMLIEKLQAKISNESQYIVIGRVPGHMANPGKCKWHIEKDGKIYDKGTGITKYHCVPNNWEFDLAKMEFKKGHDTWFGGEKKTLSDEQKKAVNDFKNLLLRFERVVNNMNTCGDGTAETEKAGLEQQQKEGYEKIIVKETKTKLQMVEVERKNIKLGDYLTFNYHGGYWKIVDEYMQKGTWKGVQMEKNAFVYEVVGAESRGFQTLRNAKRYYQYEERLLKEVETGAVKIFELKEVEVTEEVEKWVKISDTKKQSNKPKTEQKKEEVNQEAKKKQTQKTQTNNILNHEITITADTDTRDNSFIWVVKIIDKLSKEEYKKVSEQLKEFNGYYSRFKHGFIFKYDPTEVLKGEQKQQEGQTTEEVIEQETERTIERTPEQETAEEIIDTSTKFITELNIDGSTICNNEEYKTKLFDYIKNNNINITDAVINCLRAKEGYNNLIDVLELINAGYYHPIKDGFMYDCHFKQWKMSMQEIQETVTALNIPFIDWGEKIGFKCLTAEQTRQIKEINDINSSILFIDKETLETPITEQKEEKEQDLDNVINLKEYKNFKNETTEEISEENILSKFDNIEISNNSRISADDQEFCEQKQAKYNEAITVLLDFVNTIKEKFGFYLLSEKIFDQKSTNEYLDRYDLDKFKERIPAVYTKFIHDITWYFSKKYNITIDSEKIIKKYSYDITYNNILDEIFLQLAGFTFEEKAVKELKDALKQQVKRGYDNKIDVKIKNKKVVFDGYFWIDSWDAKYGNYKVSYNSDNNFNKLLTAISHFEQGTTDNCYKGIYQTITQEKDDKVFKVHSLMCIKADSMKLFKNGKVEVTFLTAEYARQFAKEYCGYIEQSATA